MKRTLLLLTAVATTLCGCGPAGTTLTIVHVGEDRPLTMIMRAPCVPGADPVAEGWPSSNMTMPEQVRIEPGQSHTLRLDPGCHDLILMTESMDQYRVIVVLERDQDATYRFDP